ncbi:MAG: deoxyribonuclease IV [Acidobacteria bacterium]|nr:deoxyribonuclease IV [Acidobacteriota bacterium]
MKAAELGANTFQIFSSSPRMWRASVPRQDDIRRLREARTRFDLRPLAIHVNYLVNLASLDPVIRARSIAAFRGELERAEAIGAEYLVVHPGSYKGYSLEQGIAAFALGVQQAAAEMAAPKVMVLIENTVGCGAQIGCRFEDLRSIRKLVGGLTDLRVGYCLDTCHLLGAGFNVATRAGLERTLEQAGDILGLGNVRLIHANDSKAPLGAHLDRHQHIGRGHIGEAGFRRILAHPRLRRKPFILETPVDDPGDDRRNLDTLKQLCPKSRTTTTRSN